ncbi:hypothetical protein CsSME_00024485 [Camellia sinensis var. sinensis]
MHHIINTAFDIPNSHTTHGTDTLYLIYWPRPLYTAINHHSRRSYTAHGIHTLQSFTTHGIPAAAVGVGRGASARSRSKAGHDDESDEEAVSPQSESS